MGKDKQNNLFDYIKGYILLLGAFGILFWKLFSKLNEFSIISELSYRYLAIICTVLSAGIVGTFFITRKRYGRKIKLSIWLSTNVDKIALGYALPLILLMSLRSKVSFCVDELKDIISVSWTIFGIIIAIYAIWQVLIPQFLKKAEPKFNEYPKVQQINRILDKGAYYEKISVYYLPLIMVAITLFVLSCATILVHLETNGSTFWNQSATVLGVYCCIETIVLLFVDVFKAAKVERDNLLITATVSKEEIEEHVAMEKKRSEAKGVLRIIDDMENLTEDEKTLIEEKLCDHFMIKKDELL